MLNDHYSSRYPTALTIAGSDSGGGAGVQADLKTFSALGVFGMSVITAITAQNTMGVKAIQPVDPDVLKAQIDAVFEDFTIDSVKIGMLHDKAVIETVADALTKYRPSKIVLDPVMVATSGSRLLEDEAIHTLVERLFPLVTLLTPNLPEAEYLSGRRITDRATLEAAAGALTGLGCPAILIKGGHWAGEKTDRLFRPGKKAVNFTTKDVKTQNTHGTGCTLSSAIAAFLALGYDLEEAIARAKAYVTSALEAGAGVFAGHGHGAVNHFFNPQPLRTIPLQP